MADGGSKQLGRQRSPKRGVYEHIFDELVSLPSLLMSPNFSIELLLIQEEEIRRYDGVRGFRRHGWVTEERKLLRVVDNRILRTPADLYSFIPSDLSEPFTTSDLATAIAKPLRLAQKMAYCLRLMDCIISVGKRSNCILYTKLTG